MVEVCLGKEQASQNSWLPWSERLTVNSRSPGKRRRPLLQLSGPVCTSCILGTIIPALVCQEARGRGLVPAGVAFLEEGVFDLGFGGRAQSRCDRPSGKLAGFPHFPDVWECLWVCREIRCSFPSSGLFDQVAEVDAYRNSRHICMMGSQMDGCHAEREGGVAAGPERLWGWGGL